MVWDPSSYRNDASARTEGLSANAEVPILPQAAPPFLDSGYDIQVSFRPHMSTGLTRSRKSAQAAYFLAVAGAAGGLLAWAVVALAAFFYLGDPLIADFIALGVFGLLVCGIAGGVASYYSEGRVSPKRVAASAGLGITLAVAAGFLQIAVRNAIGFGSVADRVLAWMSIGAFTALAIAVVQCGRRQPERLAVPFVCGLAGGAVGGVLMFVSGNAPDILAPLAYMIAGISAAVASPLGTLTRGLGRLHFISSGDKRIHDKHTRLKSEWAFRDGQAGLIGGLKNPVAPGSVDIPISLEDPEIASRHARIHAKHGRFILSRHTEIRSQAGLARFVLKANGETIPANYELADGDDILLGTTTLSFHIVPEED